MKSTLLLTRFCVCNLFWKVRVFSSRRLVSSSNLPPGFTVVATANTKGKGSEDGRFIGTNVLNEAFLERFPVTFEQSYPSPKTEQKILESLCDDTAFCKRLVDWADIIRKTFYDGGVEEVISHAVLFILFALSQSGRTKQSLLRFV